MIVNRRSWHYKLVRFVAKSESLEDERLILGLPYGWEPINSCQYFRSLGIGLLGAIVVGVPGVALLIGTSPIWGMILGFTLLLGKIAKPSEQERRQKKIDKYQKEDARRQSLRQAYLETKRKGVCELMEYEG